MKIYYEEIFILNFLLDFMILFGTKRILKINKSIIRIVLGSIIGSFTTILLFYKISSIDLLFLKIIFSFIMIIISFGFNNLFRNIFYFYINSNIIITHILLVLGSLFIIYILYKEIFNYKEKYNNKYLVDIYYKGKCYKLEGFIDTGNRLLSWKKESVILTNLYINTSKVIYVPYKALNTNGVIPCIRVDKIVINNSIINNCLIGLSKDKFSIDGINCILPNSLKEELC